MRSFINRTGRLMPLLFILLLLAACGQQENLPSEDNPSRTGAATEDYTESQAAPPETEQTKTEYISEELYLSVPLDGGAQDLTSITFATPEGPSALFPDVFCVTADGTVFVNDPAQKRIQCFAEGQFIRSLTYDLPQEDDSIRLMAAYDSFLYVLCENRKLYFINAETDERVLLEKSPAQALTPRALTRIGDSLLLQTEDEYNYLFSMTTGFQRTKESGIFIEFEENKLNYRITTEGLSWRLPNRSTIRWRIIGIDLQDQLVVCREKISEFSPGKQVEWYSVNPESGNKPSAVYEITLSENYPSLPSLKTEFYMTEDGTVYRMQITEEEVLIWRIVRQALQSF